MGEGEGVKDVSDQIENEDQLDEAQRPGEEKDQDQGGQPDVAPEDNAIEMDQEFDGKMHDMEPQGEGLELLRSYPLQLSRLIIRILPSLNSGLVCIIPTM